LLKSRAERRQLLGVQEIEKDLKLLLFHLQEGNLINDKWKKCYRFVLKLKQFTGWFAIFI